MRIKNFFKMNDWDIKSFLIVVLSIQLAYLGTVGLDKLGIQIPFLRPVLGFIYLTFIPGYLLLRVLKIHTLSSEESFLYAVGLSLFFAMFTGFLMNMLYPILGVTNKPLSEVPIVVTFTLAIILLSILAYLRDREYCNSDFIEFKEILSPQFLFLSLIPFMAIFGTYLVNYLHNNILLMVMIVVIALVSLLIGFTDLIPEKLYPYAIWVITIALIWHATLISDYIQIMDVYGEYYVANSIIRSNFWNWNINIFNNYSSVLSVTIFTPIIYYLLNMGLTWIYKIIFPVFLSIAPIGLYAIYSNYFNKAKIIYLSVYLFLTYKSFFADVPFLTKQLIAELFMILLIMLLVTNSNIGVKKRVKLMIIFGISLTVSHYGTAYLFAGSLMLTLLLLRLWKDLSSVDRKNKSSYFLNFVLMYLIICFAWYIYVSNSSVFVSIVNLGSTIQHVIFTEFFNPEYSRGAYILTKAPPSILHSIGKSLYLIVSSFIIIGFSKSFLEFILSNKLSKFDSIYLGFSLYWLGVLGAAIIVPFFAVMNPYRLYHLALIVLSPFAIVGGIAVVNLLNKLIKQTFKLIKIKIKIKSDNLKVLYALFVVYMLFSTHFIYQIANDHPRSISISQEYIKKYGALNDKGFLYSIIIPTFDISSAKWLSKYMDNQKKIYSTLGWGQGRAVLMAYGSIPDEYLQSIHYNSANSKKDISHGYIYLYYFNVIEKIFLDSDPLGKYLVFYDMTIIYSKFIKENSKIYDNDGSQVLWVS